MILTVIAIGTMLLSGCQVWEYPPGEIPTFSIVVMAIAAVAVWTVIGVWWWRGDGE